MQRRKFVIGTGALATGGAAALGTGAFSRVESHRSVTIEVANDDDAYLGMRQVDDSENSENYVDWDENGHLEIDIGGPDEEESDLGDGVNSNSITFFDEMIEFTNQGKENAEICIDTSGLEPGGVVDSGEANVVFYLNKGAGDQDDVDQTASGSTGTDVDDYDLECEDESVNLPLGESIVVGLYVDTRGVDVDYDEGESSGTLVEGQITVLADVDEANTPSA